MPRHRISLSGIAKPSLVLKFGPKLRNQHSNLPLALAANTTSPLIYELSPVEARQEHKTYDAHTHSEHGISKKIPSVGGAKRFEPAILF